MLLQLSLLVLLIGLFLLCAGPVYFAETVIRPLADHREEMPERSAADL
jgi:hypothetical protein